MLYPSISTKRWPIGFINPTRSVLLRSAENKPKVVVVFPSFIRVAAIKIRLVVLLRGAIKISLSPGSVKSPRDFGINGL